MMSSLDTKIPPPFLMLAVAIAMVGTAQLGPSLALDTTVRLVIMSAFLVIAGLVTTPAFLAFSRAKTTINPVDIDKASTLVTNGIYGFTRNPMYVGLTALLCALAAYLDAPWAYLGPIIFVAYITRFQILPEERVMEAKFGDAYRAYTSRVRRWL